MAATLVWFRQDLRLQDNPALNAAARRGAPIVPVYILDDPGEGRWPLGGAARSWLHHSLAALDSALRERGSRLILRRGDSLAELRQLAAATGADAVYWNRRFEPAARERDAAILAGLRGEGRAGSPDPAGFPGGATPSSRSGQQRDGGVASPEWPQRRLVGSLGLDAQIFQDGVLFPPETIRNKQGGPFQVFTPFWRTCSVLPVPPVVKLLKAPLSAPAKFPASLSLDELDLKPRLGWDAGFYSDGGWQPGEAGARERVRVFARNGFAGYADDRNTPSVAGTSMLSPHLRFGEISPRQVWAAVAYESRDSGVFPPNKGAAVFLNEIGWREFAYHLLTHFPHTPEQPLREAFARFPWAHDPHGARFAAWSRGRTGYPIVDAGMRQLWRTGWMHNRVRMIVASFLVKHLRLNWTQGAAWFWDTLVDADLANNTLGWQWSAGCGADAAPYFRIFAPVTQGEKFDADGAYVRRWVPELAKLPKKFIHAPWTAPAEVLAAAGVALGQSYPRPIVDHATARAEALAAFKAL